MNIFFTKKVEGEAAGNWDGIFAEAAKHHRAKITVESYTDKDEISDQQRKWLHCQAGPIQELMRDGWSFRDAKEYIKVEYGRHWFVTILTDDNIKKATGYFRWECQHVDCKKIIHPVDILIYSTGSAHSVRHCPNCQGVALIPIAIKSIVDVSVKNTNLWFKEILTHFQKNHDGTPKILQPDPEWNKKLSKKT
ncbi:MAG TPA: hypothetical protein ENH82_07625 [bacterium]|nr:hypothetical protein [bacterium]